MNKKILCFGDSNTYGYVPGEGGRYPKNVRWTGKLAEITGCEVVEEGLNGRTSAFPDPISPYLCGADYIEACVMSHEPIDLLIIMLGTNDMKTYVCNCADASAWGIIRVANMARNVLKKPDLKVLVVSPPMVTDAAFGNDWTMSQFDENSVKNTRKLGGILEGYAKAEGFFFLNAAKVAVPSDADACHLTPEGHAALAEAIAEKLKEIFE